MVDYPARIQAEFEAIEQTLAFLPNHPLHTLSSLELAGVAALLHNFYNGVENILKQLFYAGSIPVPQGAAWHKELLQAAVEKQLLSEKTGRDLQPYLAFRHFFAHAYALDLYPQRLEPLIDHIAAVYQQFKNEAESHLSS